MQNCVAPRLSTCLCKATNAWGCQELFVDVYSTIAFFQHFLGGVITKLCMALSQMKQRVLRHFILDLLKDIIFFTDDVSV